MNPAFEAYYSAIWGDRFDGLVTALLKEKRQVALSVKNSQSKPLPDKLLISELPNVYGYEDARSLDYPFFYYLDLASLYAAAQINRKGQKHIWDMCAAPGGKSLYMYNGLSDESKLLLTDLSRDRYFRLKRNFEQCTLGEYQQNTDIVMTDALQWGYKHPELYDQVLLDAPCSSEQHVLENEGAMNAWKPSRPKSLAKRQYGLLCSGMLALKSGGCLVYSTCSINPAENDGVIERFLQKKGEIADWARCDIPIGESTEFGQWILPDHSEGCGPIYISKLVKR